MKEVATILLPFLVVLSAARNLGFALAESGRSAESLRLGRKRLAGIGKEYQRVLKSKSSKSKDGTKAPKSAKSSKRRRRRLSETTRFEGTDEKAFKAGYEEFCKLHQQDVSNSQVDTVVVYTGPTTLINDDGADVKSHIYHKNFEYFLNNGVKCSWEEDVILVLTQVVASHYSDRIEALKAKCKAAGSKKTISVVLREDKCYDMESVRVVFETFDLSHYEYLVYLNCGLVGPKLPQDNRPAEISWTKDYTKLLTSEVKMAGLSINCLYHPHVQSMLFALDQVGLQIILHSNTVYDCGLMNNEMNEDDQFAIIQNYEVGMSKAIINAGFSLSSTMGPMGNSVTLSPSDVNITSLQLWCNDMWGPERITRYTSKAVPRWEDLVFFKSTRGFVLSDVLAEVEYDNGQIELEVVINDDDTETASTFKRARNLLLGW